MARPGDALALELVLAEVLLDLVPRDVQLALDDPRAGMGIDKVLVELVLHPLIVTAEVDLERVGGLAVQRRRLVLDDVGVDGLEEEDRQISAGRDELRVAGDRRRRGVVVLQGVRVIVLRADILARWKQRVRVFFRVVVSSVERGETERDIHMYAYMREVRDCFWLFNGCFSVGRRVIYWRGSV